MPKKTVKKAVVVGKVTHYYGGLGVAIAKFTKPVKVGQMVHFKGVTTDFDQVVVSMQYNHKEIKAAKKGQEVGIKVQEKAREGDEVFEV